MLGHVIHDSLRPLVYPLVQVMVGAVHLQPSARHYPLRLHIVRTLLDLSQATATFVPVAPYLLEVSKAGPFNFC
jgi:nucleolar complex protein 2